MQRRKTHQAEGTARAKQRRLPTEGQSGGGPKAGVVGVESEASRRVLPRTRTQGPKARVWVLSCKQWEGIAGFERRNDMI